MSNEPKTPSEPAIVSTLWDAAQLLRQGATWIEKQPAGIASASAAALANHMRLMAQRLDGQRVDRSPQSPFDAAHRAADAANITLSLALSVKPIKARWVPEEERPSCQVLPTISPAVRDNLLYDVRTHGAAYLAREIVGDQHGAMPVWRDMRPEQIASFSLVRHFHTEAEVLALPVEEAKP